MDSSPVFLGVFARSPQNHSVFFFLNFCDNRARNFAEKGLFTTAQKCMLEGWNYRTFTTLRTGVTGTGALEMLRAGTCFMIDVQKSFS